MKQLLCSLILDLMSPQLSLGSSLQYADGDNVSLECEVEAIPVPEIVWMRNVSVNGYDKIQN